MAFEQQVQSVRGWGRVSITLCLLVLFGVFVWRVSFYVQEIRTEGPNLAALDFSATASTIARLAQQPVTDETVDPWISGRAILGTQGAPIKIVEFGDFGCPYSRASSFVMRSLAAQYPDSFEFQYRDFPLIDLHPLAQVSAEAARCAGDQGKFWEFHDKLYQQQTSVTEESFVLFARQLNLDTTTFSSCLQAGKFKKEVEADYEAGIAAGVRGTPTFFLNGHRIAGSIPQDVFARVIQSMSTTR